MAVVDVSQASLTASGPGIVVDVSWVKLAATAAAPSHPAVVDVSQAVLNATHGAVVVHAFIDVARVVLNASVSTSNPMTRYRAMLDGNSLPFWNPTTRYRAQLVGGTPTWV